MLEINIILFKGYMIVLSAFLMVNSYCNTRIKQKQDRRKAYNLLSKIVEIELNQQEQEQLEFLMYQKNITDVNKYLRQMLFR